MNTKSIYDSYWKSGLHPDPHWDEGRVRKEFSPLLDCQKIIDYGCGVISRKYGDTMSSLVPAYIGADVSEFVVEQNKSAGFQCVTINPIDQKLPFNGEDFDGAICCEVFEHLYDPLLAAKEIYRVLRPGGKLVAMVPNYGYHAWRLLALLRAQVPSEPEKAENRYNGVHIRYFSMLMFSRLLRDAGFSSVTVEAYDSSTVWDVFFAAGPLAKISMFARNHFPKPLHLRWLQSIYPNVFAMRLKAYATKT